MSASSDSLTNETIVVWIMVHPTKVIFCSYVFLYVFSESYAFRWRGRLSGNSGALLIEVVIKPRFALSRLRGVVQKYCGPAQDWGKYRVRQVFSTVRSFRLVFSKVVIKPHLTYFDKYSKPSDTEKSFLFDYKKVFSFSSDRK